MLDDYSNSPPLNDVYHQLLNFIEIYEHNGSGWGFSYFTSLKSTLWHLDPLRASTFVSIHRWIREQLLMLLELGMIASSGQYWQDCIPLTSAKLTRIV